MRQWRTPSLVLLVQLLAQQGIAANIIPVILVVLATHNACEFVQNIYYSEVMGLQRLSLRCQVRHPLSAQPESYGGIPVGVLSFLYYLFGTGHLVRYVEVGKDLLL